MSETQPNPEALAALPKVVNEVVVLYVGDQLGAMLGTQGNEQRDQFWNETAQEFPIFGDKIRELRSRMSVVAETKKAYPPQIAQITRIPFSKVGDDMAREFLGDALFSRMTASQGYMDYGLDAAEEAKVMATEMGLQEGWRSKPAEGVTLEQAVSKVMTGNLRIAHQPKP